jgi:hypothetical protein
MASRQAVLALTIGTLACLTGCHAGPSGGLSARPEPTLPKSSPSVTQAIEKHNENALKVLALEAQPRIIVSAPGVTNGFKTNGMMALERPKNFKLVLKSMRGQEADIGSNDDEFWFWTHNKQDKSVYHCAYEDIDRAPLSAAFQPDWIVESMGFRTITKDEAAGMRIQKGDLPGTFKLVSTRTGKNGAVLTKVTVIDTAGQIREHLLYQGEGKNAALIASATIGKTQLATVADSGDTVVLPDSLRLNWVQEKLTLDIQIGKVNLLPEFTESRRQATFIEPDDPNLKRTNLATLEVPAASNRRPRASAEPVSKPRNSRGAPAIRSDVNLGGPEPLGFQDSSTTARGAVALADDAPATPPLPPAERVVRPNLPRPDDE